MVKKNDYPRKNFSKDGVQSGETPGQNNQPKSFQKDSPDGSHRENHIRNNRPPRDNQQRDMQRRENRDNQGRDNSTRENNQNSHKENFQRNYHRDNRDYRDNRDNQNREAARENREPSRQHFQRPPIKPRAEETVEDIVADISRIEKEIELELKEIRSMRLGV